MVAAVKAKEVYWIAACDYIGRIPERCAVVILIVPTIYLDMQERVGDYVMARDEEVLVSEAEIAVHWREEEYYQPTPRFIGQANVSDPSIRERFSEKNFPECFKEYADLLTWDQ